MREGHVTRGIVPVIAALACLVAIGATIPLVAAQADGTAEPTPGFAVRRGTNISHWLSQSGRRGKARQRFFARHDVVLLARLGFDHLRLPIDEEQLFDEVGRPDDEAFALLDSALDWCAASGLRVIVDLHILRAHHFNDGDRPLWTEPEAQQRFLDLWRQLSARLARRPVSQVAYEILNEPVADDPEDWNRLLARAVAVIREREPERVLVIGSNRWQSPDAFDHLKLPEGDHHILLSFHFYTPMALTHYGAGWTKVGEYEGPVAYPGLVVGDADLIGLDPDLVRAIDGRVRYFDRTVLEEQIAKPLALAATTGLPLYCGEWGALPRAPRADRLRWYADFRTVLEKNGVAWATWDYKGGFGIVDRKGQPDAELIETLLGRLPALSPIRSADLGAFEHESAVGDVHVAGAAVYDRGREEYRLTGSGANMWGASDAFRFLWSRTAGDLDLASTVRFVGPGVNPHRKAGVMVRASLAPDAPYADAVVHGDGLVSLQYRETPGGETQELQASVHALPASVRLTRRGDVFVLQAASPGQPLEDMASLRLALGNEVLAGLAVCSHESNGLETAVLSEVRMSASQPTVSEPREPDVESRLEIVTLATGARRTIHVERGRFEAPNWSRDGRHLIFNREGRLYRVAASGGEPTLLDTGLARRCNNDHGLSPDGSLLAISHSPADDSLIYVVPAAGGDPRLVTPKGPSYWHGWSPDGKTLAYCAARGGNYDVYTIPVTGGAEQRLTDAPELDDGPDYTPDGRFIYFNSGRTGLMQIWRMHADGSNQEQITNDGHADWFPHPSPDNQWLIFLSYDGGVQGHPPDKEVALRLLPLSGGEPRVLLRLFGGQGTINVPSWSPDSRELAFVSYRRLE
jgi:Tol biopolymer transport system component